LSNLESVSLGSLKNVGDRTVQALERLPLLNELSLGRTAVSDTGLSQLNPHLVSLNLFDDRITDDGVKSLERLLNLKTLNLTGTHVSDRGLSSIARLPKLETIFLGRTNVTESGIAVLHRARGSRPAIRIVR
jgi:hypothetical protein